MICVSGYAEDTVRKRLAATDDIRFMAKPFTLSQLALKVKEVLREGAR